nr:unnamed protein product [Digitaria exilis]
MAPAVSSPAGFVRVNPRSDRSHGLASGAPTRLPRPAASPWRSARPSPRAPTSPRATPRTPRSSSALALLFTAPYAHAAADASTASLPSFSAPAARRFAVDHGLAVRAVGVRVADAEEAFRASVAAGAHPAFQPVELGLGFRLAEVELYGDVVLRYVSYPHDDATDKPFLPGFEDVINPEAGALNYGLSRIDHVVGIVPKLDPVAPYMAGFTGFHEFAEFTAEDVMTSTAAESALNTVVLANNTENVLLVLSEPVHGTNQRRDQKIHVIQAYLDHHGGPGVQHVALASDDMLRTLREMRARSAMGGFEFLAPPPPNYYEGVRRRAGDVLSEAQINECQELGVLVDRDDQGVLLQIFTKPVGDRPTFFLEIIQRIGCMEKDETGQDYQKGACGGFGKGNVTELFKCLEEYGKSLEPRQAAALEP